MKYTFISKNINSLDKAAKVFYAGYESTITLTRHMPDLQTNNHSLNSKESRLDSAEGTARQARLDSARQAKRRLRWMEYYKRFRSARLTCRHFGIAPSTFYLWLGRYTPTDSTSLVDTRTRRPTKLRKPGWNNQTLLLLEQFLNNHPLARLSHMQSFLETKGLHVSISTVSRMRKML